MQKITLWTSLVVAVLALGLSACSDGGAMDAGDGDGDGDGDGEVGPGGYVVDYQSSALFFTKTASPVLGTSPHGTVRIWYSKNIENLIDDESFTAPLGTTTIKTFVNDTGAGEVVMVKKDDGFDPDNGNWSYEMRMPDGTLIDDPAPGAIPLCISCHVGFEAKDYLGGTAIESN